MGERSDHRENFPEIGSHEALAARIHSVTVIAAMQGRARRGVIGSTYTTKWFPKDDSDKPDKLRFRVRHSLAVGKSPRQVSIDIKPNGQKGSPLAVYDGRDHLFHDPSTGDAITEQSEEFQGLCEATELGEKEFDVERMERLIARTRTDNEERAASGRGRGIIASLGDDPF